MRFVLRIRVFFFDVLLCCIIVIWLLQCLVLSLSLDRSRRKHLADVRARVVHIRREDSSVLGSHSRATRDFQCVHMYKRSVPAVTGNPFGRNFWTDGPW